MVNNNNLGSRVRRAKMMHQIVPQMSLLDCSKNQQLLCRKLLIHREAMPNKQLDSIMRKWNVNYQKSLDFRFDSGST
jgi:DNA-directed RNA polymerase subunit H (RpoH/RPB5)